MDKFAISKFNGKDFAVWKFQMRAYLKFHGLLGIVEGTEARPTTKRRTEQLVEWEQKDEKAQFVISYGLEANIIRHIMSLNSAAEMWSRLSAIYEQKNKTSIHILLQKFYNYKMQPDATITEHVTAIEELAKQLTDLNQKPTDDQIITKVLYTLPPKYHHVAAAFDMLPEEQQTLPNLLPKLLKVETMSNEINEVSTNENVALISKSNQSKSKQKFKGKCHHCGKLGHKKHNCYKLKNQQSKPQANSAEKGQESTGMLYTADCDVSANANCVRGIWLADSGASKHMTFRRDILNNFVEA